MKLRVKVPLHQYVALLAKNCQNVNHFDSIAPLGLVMFYLQFKEQIKGQIHGGTKITLFYHYFKVGCLLLHAAQGGTDIIGHPWHCSRNCVGLAYESHQFP